MHKTQMEGSKGSLGFDSSFVVSSPSRSDGLGMFWNNEIKMVFLQYSQYHIDVIITEGSNEP